MSRDRRLKDEEKMQDLDSFLRESPFYRDLVKDKGVEQVKKNLEEDLLKEVKILQAAYATPTLTEELQQALDNLAEYAYEKALDAKGEKVAKVREKPNVRPFNKLIVRFLGDLSEVIEATGEVFQGREPQPVLVHLRGPKQERYCDFITMTQNVGDISLELKVSHKEARKNNISLSTYQSTPEEARKGVSGLTISLHPKEGQVVSRTTVADGGADFGEWDRGNFTIRILNGENKEIANISLEIG